MSITPLYHVYDDEYQNRIFIKRDDLIPVSFGGNKARKAINFFAEIDSGDYDCIVTYGSSSSNHCRIISNMAAGRHMPCYIISPQEASVPTFNSQLMEMFGAEIIVVNVENVHETIENKLSELRNSGKKPYFIAGGGHGDLGTQAYVECYDEIVQYETDNHIKFDYIFFASGTGTTQAGLVCGQLFHKDERNIVGISIARKNPRGRQVIINSINEYLDGCGADASINEIENKTVFIDDYTGSGYSKANEEINADIRKMMIMHGIPMDTTYVGKAFSGMKKYIAANNINKLNILFIHTGGTPLFFDYLQGRNAE